MRFPLLSATGHALGISPAFHRSSNQMPTSGLERHASQPYGIASLHRSFHLIHGAIAHGPSEPPKTETSVDDVDLGELGIGHDEHDPKTRKPIYTCPTFIYTFDCDECGGPEEITSEQPIGGTTNTLCIGFEDGLGADCECCHGVIESCAPYTPPIAKKPFPSEETNMTAGGSKKTADINALSSALDLKQSPLLSIQSLDTSWHWSPYAAMQQPVSRGPSKAVATAEPIGDDADLGQGGIVHTEHDQMTGKPMYTCPTIMYIFDCAECGGAKNITSERSFGGEPNALCVGVSTPLFYDIPYDKSFHTALYSGSKADTSVRDKFENGLWADCECYHGAIYSSAPYTPSRERKPNKAEKQKMEEDRKKAEMDKKEQKITGE